MLRVLTWNVWWRFGPWQERQAAIAATLAAADADVVCLQEVWAEEGGDDQAELLAGPLGAHVARTPHRWSGGASFGNAVLSRWPITDVEHVRLPGADGGPSHRSALLAVIDAPFGAVQVVAAHLEWRYDASAVRSAQVAALAELVARRRGDPGSAFPTIVAGDLNAEPVSEELRALTGRAPVPVPGLVFHDAWEQAGDGGPGHTWHRDNRYLASATWPGRRLDYVLVAWPRPRPLGNVRSCRLVGVDPVDGVQPSDHYAVLAELATEGGDDVPLGGGRPRST